MQVNAKSEPSIILSDQHQSTGPWTETPPDCPHFHHLLQVSFHLLIDVGWYPSIPLFKGLRICDLNIMFQDVTLPQIQIIFRRHQQSQPINPWLPSADPLSNYLILLNSVGPKPRPPPSQQGPVYFVFQRIVPSGWWPAVADLLQTAMVLLWTLMTDSSVLLQPCWSQVPKCSMLQYIVLQMVIEYHWRIQQSG